MRRTGKSSESEGDVTVLVVSYYHSTAGGLLPHTPGQPEERERETERLEKRESERE